jgi:hypothetical protein
METLHEKLIAELLDPRSALSPREIAAANEIRSLREKLTEQKAVKVAPVKQEAKK